MKTRIKQLSIGLGMIGLLTFLFIHTNSIDPSAHDSYRNNLHRMKDLDATIDREILKSRYGLTSNYDSLMSDLQELLNLRQYADDIPYFVQPDGRGEISGQIENYYQLASSKEKLIELFKSRNAVMNNSLRYFPVSASRVAAKMFQDDGASVEAQSLNEVLRETLIFYVHADQRTADQILQRINKLKQFEHDHPSSANLDELDITLRHATNILKYKPELDDLIEQIVSVPTRAAGTDLINNYDLKYNEAVSRANYYRLSLYLFSILLLVYAGYFVVKQQKTKGELNRANENLEQRVDERTAELVLSNETLTVEIKERKRMEAALSGARAFLHAVIDNVPNLIFVKDTEGRFVLANQAIADLLGTTSQAMIGMSSDDFGNFLGEDGNNDDIEILQNFDEKFIPEEKYTDQNGTSRWFQTVKRSLAMEDQGERFLIGVSTDLTERKLMEGQLRNAQKLESIGQLAAGIAHEINTPTQYVGDNTRFVRDAFGDFSSILGKYGILLESARSGSVTQTEIIDLKGEIEEADLEFLLEEVPKAIEHSLDGVSRIAKIVQSMKDFAHPGSTDKKVADLNRAIESTVTVAHNEWRYVAELETHFDRNLPLVPCFLGEFNQVILNMVINAAHAISDVVGDGSNGKGKITISTTKVSDLWAEVRVGDTGGGIPLEAQSKIFDPFFTTKEVGRGTGQGLAISHTVVVEKHNGELTFETTPGAGTTFIIRIPLARDPAAT